MKRLYLLLLLLPTLLTAQDFDRIKDSLKNKYEYIGYLNKGVAEARTKQQKYTLLDDKGKELFAPSYDYIRITHEGFFEAEVKDGKKFRQGYINKDGSVRVPLIYDNVYMPSDIAIFAVKDGEKGVLDTLGNTVIPIKFDYILDADKGYYFASKNNLSALYHDNTPLTDFIFTDADRFENDMAAVIIKDKGATVIDKSGKALLTPIKSHKIVKVLAADAIIYNLNTRKYGITGFDSTFKIQCKYDRIETAAENFIVTLGEKKGLVDIKGKELIPITYRWLYYEGNDLYFAGSAMGMGVINSTNTPVISGKYEDVYQYRNNYILATSNNQTGIFSLKGKVLLPLEYTFYNVYHNVVFCSKDFKCYLLNIGNPSQPIKLENIDSFKERGFSISYDQSGYQIFKRGAKYGVVSYKAEVVMPAMYDDLQYIYDSPEFIAKQNGNYGIVNSEGKVIEAFIYDSATIGKEHIVLKKAGRKDVYHYVVFTNTINDLSNSMP